MHFNHVQVRLIDALSGAGLKAIEATSFVSPKSVPHWLQNRHTYDMSDIDPHQVFMHHQNHPGNVAQTLHLPFTL